LVAQGTPQGSDKISAPYSLNNLGEAVGVSETPSADVATLFSNGTITIVKLGAIAEGINDAGQIGGFGGFGGEASIHNNGKITGLDTPAIFPSDSQAYAVNNSGQVVGIGYLDSTGGSFHAFLYSGGKTIDIGPPGAYQAWASAINDSRQIVGPWSSASGGGAFLYSNGKSVSLPGGSA
jgi:probable HAF family extracellular repeat protein